MGLMRSVRSWRKKNGWNVPVDLSQQNYCAATRLLLQFAFVDFSDGLFRPNPGKVQSCQASKQASGEWKVNHLTAAAEEEDYRVHPAYLSLSFWIPCNLKKNSVILFHTVKLFIFFFFLSKRWSPGFLICHEACRKSPVDCSDCWHSASVRTERLCDAHRRVRNNGDANETTPHTPQRLRGQWRGR